MSSPLLIPGSSASAAAVNADATSGTQVRPGDAADDAALRRAQENALVDLLAIPAIADALGERFRAAGHVLYLVGGSVRDALLGRGGQDLDFTTDARPERIQELLTGWADTVWDTGIEFGTLGARRGDHVLEITTFRADAYDRVGRNPVVRFGDSIEGDLVRRDFTVNAMAVEVHAPAGERRFVDPHGGLAALAAGTLDTPARSPAARRSGRRASSRR